MKSFTPRTKLYLYATYVTGIAVFGLEIRNMNLSSPGLLVALCVLASLALILKVEGSTTSSHYTFSFLVYGFTFAVYGPAEAILVIVVSNLVEWIWNKPAWFIQLFNTGSYILVMAAAGLAYSWINPANSQNTWQAALAIMVGMAVFNLLNHLMVGIVVWLARGENFKESGIFDFFPLMLDLTLLYFGASLSIVWNYNAYALGLFLIPLYLIYNTLRVPSLERQTEVDGKTGLFNHEYFKKQLNNELARSNRFDRPLSIILADLDLLRNINNAYGHLAGDEVLIGMAKAMKESVRDYDVVCRFGGEEFAVLLPETTLSQAYERAEVIRRNIEALEFTVPTSITPIRATMSFGVAHRENFSQAADEITHNADLALYHSKLSGRNRSFAFVDDKYIDFQKVDDGAQSSQKPAVECPRANGGPKIQEPALAKASSAAKVETVDYTLKTDAVEADKPQSKAKFRAPKYVVEIFIGMLALVSLLSLSTVLHWMPFTGTTGTLDWVGLTALSVLIALSEGFSVDLHAQKTSVSTSAIPILVACLIFGSAGVVCASLILAITLAIKYRSPFSRFVFNLGNHVLAGSLILIFVWSVGNNFLGLAPLHQIILTLVSAAILYFTTTWMVAFGMSLDLRHPAVQIWKEQFSWLAPYYLGIGFIAYALMFGYRHDRTTGLLLMVIPMVLLRVSQKQYIDRTREIVTELREKNQILNRNTEEMAAWNDGLLTTLSEIIDLRDPFVLGHSRKVSDYAVKMAASLGLKEKQIDLIRKAGLLHDIGKLGIAIEILTKPGRLTHEEYDIIKEHAALGGELLKNSPSLRPLVPIIRHHHEYYNGEGYPDRLAGNQISIEARILAVADAIEAMTSDRPYRRGLSLDLVEDELRRNSGSQFDPTVVESALEMLGAENFGGKVAPIRMQTHLRVSQKSVLMQAEPGR